jgi:hypothetical protein
MEDNGPGFSFSRKQISLTLVGAFVFARLVNLIALPVEGLRGYGDFDNYYLINQQLSGLPFFHYWVEYPPVFPFLTRFLYQLSGGKDHIFTYLLVFLLTAADAGSLILFWKIACRLFPSQQALWRAGVYLLVLVVLPYSWWYFDPLAIFCMLLGLYLALERRWSAAGAAAAVGIALKFFPGLILLAAWQRASWKQLLWMSVISITPVVLLIGGLWWASPEYTAASLRAQASKGSWETIWAILDGNMRTGLFGPITERMDPAAAVIPRGNPAVIPPLASLLVFGGVGLAGLLKAKRQDELQAIALVGFAWALFLLWSPGWSPQWVLYLLPLILLTLPGRQSLLFGAVLILINLLEWPVLLSRGYFSFLWITIVLRTLVLAILCLAWGEKFITRQPGQR